MKKILNIAIVALFLLLVSCGTAKEENISKIEIETGIPDVQMFIEENLTKDERADTSDWREQLVNKDGQNVYYRRWGSDGTEMEIYENYHLDGRLYQKLVKHYDRGGLYMTDMEQYDYIQDSKDVVVTIWQKRGEIIGSDTVTHTMTNKKSDVYCYSIFSDSGKEYITLKIRGIAEFRNGGKVAETEYLAGKAAKVTDKFVQ